MSTIIKAAVAVVMCVGLASGQANPVGWQRVQSIDPGHTIRVQTANKQHDGTFVKASDADITFQSREDGQVTVARSEVLRVHARSKSHRMRNAIIGAAIGGAASAVLYGTLGVLLQNEGSDDVAQVVLTPIAMGAGIGAILPTGRLKKVYDAQQR